MFVSNVILNISNEFTFFDCLPFVCGNKIFSVKSCVFLESFFGRAFHSVHNHLFGFRQVSVPVIIFGVQVPEGAQRRGQNDDQEKPEPGDLEHFDVFIALGRHDGNMRRVLRVDFRCGNEVRTSPMD